MAEWAEDPIPPGHGEPEPYGSKITPHQPQPESPRMYAVVLVYPDGNPQVESRWTSLAEAIDAAERERQWHLERGFFKSRFFVGVQDDDDPERGWLTEEDMP